MIPGTSLRGCPIVVPVQKNRSLGSLRRGGSYCADRRSTRRSRLDLGRSRQLYTTPVASWAAIFLKKIVSVRFEGCRRNRAAPSFIAPRCAPSSAWASDRPARTLSLKLGKFAAERSVGRFVPLRKTYGYPQVESQPNFCTGYSLRKGDQSSLQRAERRLVAPEKLVVEPSLLGRSPPQ